MPFISIVVPAYNPGEHFGDCLRSIAGQTFDDYELVVVDDGSAAPVDASYVTGFFGPKAEVSVVRTGNCGPYAARRRGIVEARGAYIMSVDSDDELIGEGALEKIAAALRATVADMLLINASCRRDGAEPLLDYSGLMPEGAPSGVVGFEPAAFRGLFASDYIFNSAWAKVIRHDCVGGAPAPWPRIVMADDRMLGMDYLPSIRSSALLNEALYFYRPAEASITHSGYRPEYYLQVCETESRVLSWLDKVGFDERSWAGNFLNVTCGALLALSYNKGIGGRELEVAFDEVRSQAVYARAVGAGGEGRLGPYERAQLSLLAARRYKALHAMMAARGAAAGARRAFANVMPKGVC